jgi:hypothetical protein
MYVHRVDDAAELGKEAVTGRFDDATPMLGDFGIAEFVANRAQRRERALFVLAHQPRIAGDIDRLAIRVADAARLALSGLGGWAIPSALIGWLRSGAIRSTRLDSLLIREITGKFVGPSALVTVSTSKRRFISATSSQIPCATEQGINCSVAGNSIRSSRNHCA